MGKRKEDFPEHESQQFAVELGSLTPNLVKDIMLIFARTVAQQPEFFLDSQYTKDESSLIKLAFDPVASLNQINEGLKNDPINPVVISSAYSLPEEGVLFRKLKFDSPLVCIKYEPGDWNLSPEDYDIRDHQIY